MGQEILAIKFQCDLRLLDCRAVMDYEYVLSSERRISYRVGPALLRCLQFLWEPHHLKRIHIMRIMPSFSKASPHQRLSRMPSIDKESPELVACPPYLAGVC